MTEGKIEKDFISDYVDGYELRGDNGDYSPTENERLLIEDAIRGIVEEKDFIQSLIESELLSGVVVESECPNYIEGENMFGCENMGAYIDYDKCNKDFGLPCNGKLTRPAKLSDVNVKKLIAGLIKIADLGKNEWCELMVETTLQTKDGGELKIE